MWSSKTGHKTSSVASALWDVPSAYWNLMLPISSSVPIKPLDQNPQQTVTRATILLVYIPAKIKKSLIWKDDSLFAKIGIFCKSLAGPFSEAKTHWMVNWLQLLNELYGVIPRSLCIIRLNDVSEMFNCRERRWIDVLAVLIVFGFLRFDLSMRCQFHSFFLQYDELYGADGASLLLKSVSNIRTHSATLPWFSK